MMNSENYLRSSWPASEYKLSVYAIFLNRAIDLLKTKGQLGLILPDSFLLGSYFSKLRRHILDNCKIKQLVLIFEDFWQGGTVGRSVLLSLEREVHKNLRDNCQVDVNLCKNLEDLGARNFRTFSYSQQYFEKTRRNRFRMFFDSPSKEFVEKLEKNTTKLSEIVSIHTGIRSKVGQKMIA